MPSAQGRITVRRRPKDGDNGSDSIIYHFIPSSSSIVLQKDGTLRPSALSARLVKNEGGLDIDMTQQAFGGYTVQCVIKNINGTSTKGYTPGTSIVLPSALGPTLLSVDFELKRDGKVAASMTVPCIPAGVDGVDAFILDLDNEMQGIPCNSSGTPIGSGTLASTNATVYKGASVDSGWTFSKEDTNCTSTIDSKTGTVSVTAIAADKASVKVIATKGTQTLAATMSLYKVKTGANGTSPVVYSIEVSASAISKDKNGTLNPVSISAYKMKTVGNSHTRTADMILKYYREGQETVSQAHILSGQGGVINGMNDSCTAVVVTLYATDGSTVIDRERIPVVKDGADGQPGEDAYILDLDNEMQGIPCDSSGVPIVTGALATTNATVYRGSTVDTGWSFEAESDGCTAETDPDTGTVSVTAMTDDKATVTVTADKSGKSLIAVMSLYKVKAGADGVSPAVYSIDVSSNAISLRKDGTLSPSTISVLKVKTVGNSRERTTEKILKYYRAGQETASDAHTLNGQGGVIRGIESTCTAVVVTLYDTDGTTIIDRERIPVVRDGDDGEGAISIKISPQNVLLKRDGKPHMDIRVYVDLFKGESPIPYGDTENGNMLCSPLSNDSAGLVADGLLWSFGTDSGRFYYSFAYTGTTDVNTEIPFTITYNDKVYSEKIVVKTVADGNDGVQGIQGCIYRRSKFATGFEFRNDVNLKTDGIRYIDLVYIMQDSSMFASRAKWFRCKKTHNSSADNAPQLTSNGTESWLEYWEPLNTMEPIYTPLLLADDAIITLMQSNQILITNDDGVVTAGFSGSNSGKKIRIWAGAQLPDDAPFRVDVLGALFSSNANITGKITATSGKIAGFNISGESLTNGPEFNNDACIIFRNDAHKTFAGIGGNVLPATTAMRAVARFENEDSNDFWGLGRNIAMLLSAKNADINHAFLGSGNGNLDGWIGGYKYSRFQINGSNTVFNGYLKLRENNRWIVYSASANSGVMLPSLSEVQTALGISDSTKFCVEFTILADLLCQYNFKVYGRTKLEITTNGVKGTPYFSGEYPVITHWNGGRFDNVEMASGDSLTLLLIYDSTKSGVLDTDFQLKYTARIINQQN